MTRSCVDSQSKRPIRGFDVSRIKEQVKTILKPILQRRSGDVLTVRVNLHMTMKVWNFNRLLGKSKRVSGEFQTVKDSIDSDGELGQKRG
jgi:hypothetical protein